MQHKISAKDDHAAVHLSLGGVLGALEEHVLEEMCTSIPIISLIATSRLDENSNCNALPGCLFRSDSHPIGQGGHLSTA
eukprot:758105-Hanusia_phi.AAC.1